MEQTTQVQYPEWQIEMRRLQHERDEAERLDEEAQHRKEVEREQQRLAKAIENTRRMVTINRQMSALGVAV